MYINKRTVKRYINSEDKQISPEGMTAIDYKVEKFLARLVNQFNGHKARLTAVNVNLERL